MIYTTVALMLSAGSTLSMQHLGSPNVELLDGQNGGEKSLMQ